MSTTYYFKLKDEYQDQICSIASFVDRDDISDFFSLKIGRRSYKRLPIFYANKHYKSVSEIKAFYDANSSKMTIVSEYGEELTWEELEDELINWNKDNPEASIPLESDFWFTVAMDGGGFYFIKD